MTNSNLSDDPRFYYDQSKRDFVLSMVKGSKDEFSDDGPFNQNLKLFMFAAAYGFSQGKFEPVEVKAKKPPDPDRLSLGERDFETLIHLITYSHTQEVSILGDDIEAQNKKVEIMNGYANGGLMELQEKFGRYTDKITPLKNLIDSKLKDNREA